jgi:hypothetical protein
MEAHREVAPHARDANDGGGTAPKARDENDGKVTPTTRNEATPCAPNKAGVTLPT